MFSADKAGTTASESEDSRMNERIDFDMMDLLLCAQAHLLEISSTKRQAIAIKSREIYIKSVDISRLALERSLIFQTARKLCGAEGYSRIKP
jgi:hypothetical protein